MSETKVANMVGLTKMFAHIAIDVVIVIARHRGHTVSSITARRDEIAKTVYAVFEERFPDVSRRMARRLAQLDLENRPACCQAISEEAAWEMGFEAAVRLGLMERSEL